MKIGILTFHCAINYGAIMQSYGLQEYLKKLGHEAYLLDYRPECIIKNYRIFRWHWSESHSLQYNTISLIRELLVLPKRLLRNYRFKRFSEKNIRLLSFNEESLDLDAIITGSDQIWNSFLTNGFNKIYFGQFPSAENKLLLSYAASAGNNNSLNSNEDELRDLLSSYKAIGVRENSLYQYLCDIVNPNLLTVTLDPVLLAGKEVYERHLKSTRKNKPYLLVFQLSYDDKLRASSVAKIIAKQKGLEVVEMTSSSESLKNKDLLTIESPENFITLFHEASYVVTTSFHGTAFSILFEKDFNAVSLDDQTSERINNLLETLGITERMVDKIEEITTTPISYNQINIRLDELRLHSEYFLKSSLIR